MPGLRPLPPHELAMPAQERLWRHHETVPALIGKQPSERGDEGAIRREELRTLPAGPAPRVDGATRSARCPWRVLSGDVGRCATLLSRTIRDVDHVLLFGRRALPPRLAARPFPGRRWTEASPLAQLFHTVLELAVVLSLVIVAERRSDEAIVSDRPLLESADPDPAPRSTRAGVRSYERPAVFGVSA
jgi:hypothetical protein